MKQYTISLSLKIIFSCNWLKRFLYLLLFLFIVSNLYSQNCEHRGIWIPPKHQIYLPYHADTIISRVNNANMNVLYIEVYSEGYSVYPSDFAYYNKPFDILQYFIDNNSGNWDIIAAFGIGKMPEEDTITPLRQWGKIDASGYPIKWINYANIEATDWLRNLIIEVLQNYNIKGIQLDFIRELAGARDFISASAYTNGMYEENFGTRIYPLPLDTVLTTFGRYKSRCPYITNSTTANVISQFTGNINIPAIMINEYGLGEVLYFNWDPWVLTGSNDMFGGEFHIALKNFINSRSINTPHIAVVSDQSPVQVDLEIIKNTLDWYGFNYNEILSSEINLQSEDSTIIVCSHCHEIGNNNNLIDTLISWVLEGGNAIFIGGVGNGITTNVSLQQLIGGNANGSDNSYDTIFVHKAGVNYNYDSSIIDTIPTNIDQAIALNELEKWNTIQELLITNFVEDIHDTVKSLYPDRLLSAAVFRTPAIAHTLLQNWTDWTPNYLDYVFTMSYTNDTSEFENYCSIYQDLGYSNSSMLFPGITIPDNSNESIIWQIKKAREFNFNGHILFNALYLADSLYEHFTVQGGVYEQWVPPCYPITTTIDNYIDSNNLVSFVYPNPATNKVTVEFINPSKTINIYIFSATGQMMYNKTIKNLSVSKHIENFDISMLSRGFYFIQIQYENSFETKKIVIQ